MIISPETLRCGRPHATTRLSGGRRDGAVEFRIHGVSRWARAGNPLLRLGFRLVGRRRRVRFARRACERMRELVERVLTGGGPAAG